MNPGSILIGLAILIAVIPWVASPILNGKKKKASTGFSEFIKMDDLHEVNLLALRDLEFDHRTGKVTDADYDALRINLLSKLATSLTDKQNRVDVEIEEKIQARRKSRSVPNVCHHCGATIEPSDHFCRACGTSLPLACPKCGSGIQANDKFCNVCGTPISMKSSDSVSSNSDGKASQ